MVLEVGTLLGRYQQYQVVEVLSHSNAFGTQFYRAYDLRRQVTVGLYQISERLKPAINVEQFYEHIALAASVNDPNRIRIVDFEVGEEISIITEWIDGFSLLELMAQLRQKSQLPRPIDIVEIAQQIGCALESLVLNAEAPRLISPNTVMIAYRLVPSDGTTFRAVLTDLGIRALIPDEAAPPHYQRDDYGFLAREQFITATDQETESVAENAQYAHTTYALGELLYWLLMGRTSTGISSWSEGVSYWEQHKEHAPQPLRIRYPAIPPALERVILVALATSATKRFDRPSAMVAALARASASVHGASVYDRDFGPVSLVAYLRKLAANLPAEERRQSVLTFAKDHLVIAPGVSDTVEMVVQNLNPERAERFRINIENPHTAIRGDWITVFSQQAGLANYQESARFSLTIQPPAGVFIPAGDYTVIAKVFSSIQEWRVIDEKTIKVVVRRVADGVVDAIWPQEIESGTLAQLGVRNLGNFRESFRVNLRSENSTLDFAPTQMAAVINPGQSELIPFRPFPRRRPWFGRMQKIKVTAQVAMLQSGKLELATAQVFVRSIFPPLLLVSTFLGLVLFLLSGLWLSRPSVDSRVVLLKEANMSADPCQQLRFVDMSATEPEDGCLIWTDPKINKPALVVGWKLGTQNTLWSTLRSPFDQFVLGANQESRDPPKKVLGGSVKSMGLLLYPQQQILIPITRTIGVMLKDNSNEIMTLTADIDMAEYMLYVYPNAENLSLVNNPRLIVRNRLGEADWLGPLRWLGTRSYDIFYSQVTAAPIPVEAPVPNIGEFCIAADMPNARASCTKDEIVAANWGYYAYQLSDLRLNWMITGTVDGTELLLEPLGLRFDPTTTAATIPAPVEGGTYSYTLQLVDAMKKPLATHTILLTVKQLNCRVARDGLLLYKSPGYIYETLGKVPVTAHLIQRSQPTDYAQNDDEAKWVHVTIMDTAEDGWVEANGLACETPSQEFSNASALPATNSNDPQPVPGQASPQVGESTGSNRTPEFAVEKPEFSATITPPPTPNPTPTSTPEPLLIDISVDRSYINKGECVELKWTITGVEAVYYGRSDRNDSYDDLVGIANNNDHVEQECDIEKTIDFLWLIVVATEPNYAEVIQTRTVNVRNP